LSLWHRHYDSLRFVDKAAMKAGPKIELMAYHDAMYQKVEAVKKTLKENWLRQLGDIYRACQKRKQLPPESKIPALLRSLSVQMTNQMQSLCLQSMEDFDSVLNYMYECYLNLFSVRSV